MSLLEEYKEKRRESLNRGLADNGCLICGESIDQERGYRHHKESELHSQVEKALDDAIREAMPGLSATACAGCPALITGNEEIAICWRGFYRYAGNRWYVNLFGYRHEDTGEIVAIYPCQKCEDDFSWEIVALRAEGCRKFYGTPDNPKWEKDWQSDYDKFGERLAESDNLVEEPDIPNEQMSEVLFKEFNFLIQEAMQIQVQLKNLFDESLENDSVPLDAVDQYRQVYFNLQAVTTAEKMLKDKLEIAKATLINLLKSQGYTSSKRDSINYIYSVRNYPQIDDYDELMNYVSKLDEPRSGWVEEVFKKKKLKEAIDEAIEQHPGEEEQYLPPGLGYYTKEVITVRDGREASGKKESTPATASDVLKQIAQGESK